MSLRFLVESHFAAVRSDIGFWRPHLEEIARRHGLALSPLEATLGESTNAVFFVGDAVVKIYTPYFHGRESKGMEVATLKALSAVDRSLPIPQIRATGNLLTGSSDWNWPYAVLSRMKGRVLDADWAILDDAQRRSLLRELGALIARIHKVAPTAELGETYRRLWPRGLNEFLAKQLDLLRLDPDLTPLPIAEEVRQLTLSTMGPAWPAILHADLEPAHIFHQDGKLSALIDFGDSKLGDPLYDFVLVRKSFAEGDPSLLTAFFEGYGSDPRGDDEARSRLGLYTLLHEWVKLQDVSRWIAKSGAGSLRVLSDYLWSPG